VEGLYESIDRVRWCVPTESIDEFINIWSVENRMDVPNTQESLNFAPNKDHYADLVELVHRFPHLYSVDLLLWDIARTRYAAYRATVLREASGLPYPDNVSKAFCDGDYGIWLRQGWHPAQQVQGGRNEWWAGPERFSVVRYKKEPHHRFIKFLVSVVCGIRREDIKASTESRQNEIPTELRSLGGDRHELWIDLGGLPDQGSFSLCVPEVCSPMMMDANSDDALRKSFAGMDWSFA
jgi:hypothetical protein